MNKKIFLFLVIISSWLLLSMLITYAQENPEFIQLLPNLPGTDPNQINNFPSFIIYIVNFSFWVVGLALFGAFLYSGILWLTAAGNMAKISKAREVLMNAILGFILLLSSWLILNVINPDLVKTKLEFPPISDTETQELTNRTAVIKNENAIAITGIPKDTETGLNFIRKAEAQIGIYAITVEVRDAQGLKTSEEFNIEVKKPGFVVNFIKNIVFGVFKWINPVVQAQSTLSIQPPFLANAVIGEPYFQKISASGGTGPYNWTVTGNLPSGLTVQGISKATVAMPIPTSSPNIPAPTSTPTTPPLSQTTPPKKCKPAGTFPSTCPSSGYTFIDPIYTCNVAGSCLFDEDCPDPGLSCNLQSTGGCECGVGGIGSCCQQSNSLLFATKETAETLASCLGAKRVVGSQLGGPYRVIDKNRNSVLEYGLEFENGMVLNAGLVANKYMKYPKNLADRMLEDELSICP